MEQEYLYSDCDEDKRKKNSEPWPLSCGMGSCPMERTEERAGKTTVSMFAIGSRSVTCLALVPTCRSSTGTLDRGRRPVPPPPCANFGSARIYDRAHRDLAESPLSAPQRLCFLPPSSMANHILALPIVSHSSPARSVLGVSPNLPVVRKHWNTAGGSCQPCLPRIACEPCGKKEMRSASVRSYGTRSAL